MSVGPELELGQLLWPLAPEGELGLLRGPPDP